MRFNFIVKILLGPSALSCRHIKDLQENKRQRNRKGKYYVACCSNLLLLIGDPIYSAQIFVAERDDDPVGHTNDALIVFANPPHMGADTLGTETFIQRKHPYSTALNLQHGLMFMIIPKAKVNHLLRLFVKGMLQNEFVVHLHGKILSSACSSQAEIKEEQSQTHNKEQNNKQFIIKG
jgi:hypothetical protein